MNKNPVFENGAGFLLNTVFSKSHILPPDLLEKRYRALLESHAMDNKQKKGLAEVVMDAFIVLQEFEKAFKIASNTGNEKYLVRLKCLGLRFGDYNLVKKMRTCGKYEKALSIPKKDYFGFLANNATLSLRMAENGTLFDIDEKTFNEIAGELGMKKEALSQLVLEKMRVKNYRNYAKRYCFAVFSKNFDAISMEKKELDSVIGRKEKTRKFAPLTNS